MITTKVFQNGNSQAVRIPKEMRTNRKEFIIRQIGESYLIYPVDDPWYPVRQTMGTFPEDFMIERNQPTWEAVPQREEF